MTIALLFALLGVSFMANISIGKLQDSVDALHERIKSLSEDVAVMKEGLSNKSQFEKEDERNS